MPQPQLFMFHFAGGNSYSFNFAEAYLNKFKIETIELPGRGARSDESLIKDFNQAADDIYKQIRSRLNSKYFVIYGHSMGALLAFKVTKMLELNNVAPLYLIVTGNAGPRIRENIKRHLLNDVDFITEIKKLGGLSAEFLESKELLDYFIPILKADFEIAEENNLDEKTVVSTPIYAIMGDKEKHAESITNWSNYTISDFNFELLEGNHFFIFNHAGKISSIINQCYKEKIIQLLAKSNQATNPFKNIK